MQMSENERPSAYVTGRLASDPIGSMQTPVRMKAGETVAGSTFDAEVIARLTAVSYRGAIAVDPNGTQFRLANGYTKAVQPTGLYFAFWGTWVQGFNVATTQANIRVIDAYLTESPGESAVKHSPGDAGLSPG